MARENGNFIGDAHLERTNVDMMRSMQFTNLPTKSLANWVIVLEPLNGFNYFYHLSAVTASQNIANSNHVDRCDIEMRLTMSRMAKATTHNLCENITIKKQ